MTPASDHIPIILAGLDGPLKLYHYLTFLDLQWTLRHMDFRFFTLTSLPRPGEAVSFLLTCLPEQFQKESRGDLYYHQCERARGGGHRYHGDFFPIRDTHNVFSVWKDASSWRGEKRHFVTWVKKKGFDFCFAFGAWIFFTWDQRVGISKSDSHLDRDGTRHYYTVIWRFCCLYTNVPH